jgi:acetyltransferase
MPDHYLDRFFNPRSIAVIGASDDPHSVGMRVLANLKQAGFDGELLAVNPKHERVQGLPCHPSLEAIRRRVDMAVVSTPASTLPAVIEDCARAGVRALVVQSTGVTPGSDLERRILGLLRRHGIRLIGPNCLGIMRPARGLNATFSRNRAAPGHLALVSQSGALMAAILDWADEHRIGFSFVGSLGNAVDVNFGDLLDYLALDRETHSILLYLEGIRNPRRFMSGLRAAARVKPVLVVKAGRHGASAKAAASHAGALLGADDVVDAALARAGAIRVDRIEQLFAAARLLPYRARFSGKRVAVVTDGGGPAVIATDRAVGSGLKLAALAERTLGTLDRVLPRGWSRGNPVDLLEDASAERYRQAMRAVLSDPGVDAVLTIVAPQAMTDPLAIADAVIEESTGSDKLIACCWMGEAQVRAARERLTAAGLPHFDTPETAVDALAALARHRDNQKLLLQVPSPTAYRSAPQTDGARLIVEGALGDRRDLLDARESKAVLRAYGIPVTHAVEAATASEALVAAESLGFPVAMKISSRDIPHKTRVDGVRLDLRDAHAVLMAYQELMDCARARRPGADLRGVTVEPMANRRDTRELLVGVAQDPVFGPVITLGLGGALVEVVRRYAVALPPLNPTVARDLIERSGVAALLQPYPDRPAIRDDDLVDVLVAVSALVCDLPEVTALDVNPLMIDARGVIAVDARIALRPSPPGAERYAHLAIHPYPDHLVRTEVLADGTRFLLRPIRPEDAEMEQRFVAELSPESRYFRFMSALERLSPDMLARFTQIDYDREMAFVAIALDGDREAEEMGVARYTTDADETGCEFALVIGERWRNRGLASRLLGMLMECARRRGLTHIHGEVLATNAGMLRLMRKLGFSILRDPEDASVRQVSRAL